MVASISIKYRVVVGGRGVVYDGEDQSEANRICATFIVRSKAVEAASDAPTVTLFKDYQIIRQWQRRTGFVAEKHWWQRGPTDAQPPLARKRISRYLECERKNREFTDLLGQSEWTRQFDESGSNRFGY